MKKIIAIFLVFASTTVFSSSDTNEVDEEMLQRLGAEVICVLARDSFPPDRRLPIKLSRWQTIESISMHPNADEATCTVRAHHEIDVNAVHRGLAEEMEEQGVETPNLKALVFIGSDDFADTIDKAVTQFYLSSPDILSLLADGDGVVTLEVKFLFDNSPLVEVDNHVLTISPADARRYRDENSRP